MIRINQFELREPRSRAIHMREGLHVSDAAPAIRIDEPVRVGCFESVQINELIRID